MIHKIRDELHTVQYDQLRYRVNLLRYVDSKAHCFDDVTVQRICQNGKLGQFLNTKGRTARRIIERLQRRQANH